MKILIVTMHRGYNYGSALQIYALSEKIKEMGHDVVVLDYIPARINFKKNLKFAVKKLFGKNTVREKYNTFRGLCILLSSEYTYNKFFHKHLKLTGKYFTIEDLERKIPEADVYMTGSDQVWNSTYNGGINKVFFLDFVPSGCKKVAYAASFGKKILDDWEIPATQQLLQQYNALSVREDSGLDILQSLGINTGKHVLDPTLLFSKKDWESRCYQLPVSEKYLLIYSVEPNKEELINQAQLIAKQLNLKTYIAEWGFKKYPGVDKMIPFISPLELMSYFIHAEYIIASSFHGTAFSVNLNKQFISVSPKRFGTRAQSLLSLVGLEERMVTFGDFNLDKALKPIDYVEVNNKLQIQRELSMQFLQDAFLNNEKRC